ncbi:MAG: alpha-galactosidase, partial [Chloroflexota bacterium]
IRLRSPAGNEDAAWMVVAPDQRTAIVAHVRILAQPVQPPDRLRLRGLDGALTYRVEEWSTGTGHPPSRSPAEVRFGGDLLMAAGLVVRSAAAGHETPSGDFAARLWVLSAD